MGDAVELSSRRLASRWGAAATLWGMISVPVRAALPPLAVAAILVGGAAWLWPASGSPTVDQAVTMCRQQVADRLHEPNPTFADLRTSRDGDAVQVAGAAISYTPVATYDWTCRARGRYAGDVQVDDVQVTNRG